MSEISCNHTLILLTRNRPSWIAATLRGYLKFEYQGVLFLVDDSEGEALMRNQQTVKNLQNNCLKVMHLSDFSKSIEFRHKRVSNSLRKALDLVETDFLTITSDDDFFFPTFIEPAVAFLNDNPDHSAVVGPETIVWTDEKLNVMRESVRWWPVYQSKDPLERFANYCHSQSVPTCGVFRSNFIQVIKKVEARTDKPFTGGDSIVGSNFLDSEIQWEQLLVSSGKIGELPLVPMNIRGWHKSDNRLEMTTFKNVTLPTIQTHGTFMEMLDDRFPETLRHWVDEACTWIMLCGTKYSEDQVYDTVLRWNQKMLFQYQGAGPHFSPDAFSKDLRGRKAKLEPTKDFLLMVLNQFWGILKVLLMMKSGSILDLGSSIKNLWPINILRKRTIRKSREVLDYMDHFHSLEKGPLRSE